MQRVGACRDAGDNLLISPSVSRSSDGSDYIEGGGGNDVIFGDGAQNDILGGNSDFFGDSAACTAANETTRRRRAPARGPTARTRSSAARARCSTAAAWATAHRRATTQLRRHRGRQRRDHPDRRHERPLRPGAALPAAQGPSRSTPPGSSRFNYDNYTDGAAVVAAGAHRRPRRHAARLHARRPRSRGTAWTASSPGTSEAPRWSANAADGIAAGTLQTGSEIHAESGDAFVYGGPADDVLFGGGQNDTIITGYGDNWVSGGRGDQCIIGGGGRCFASRVGLANGEPSTAIAPTPAANISELITTPGNVQQAMINVNGSLQYTAELYPYNWDPTTRSAPGVSNGNPTYSTNCKENKICPVYAPRYGHNIIYGGWGNGVVHGGPGQSAISGAEAPILGYADNFNMYGNTTAAAYMATGVADTVLTDYVINKAPIETDFYRPFNPGNPVGYMPNTDPPNGNQGRGFNIGKSLYFDAEDPRRQVDLFPTVVDPTVTGDGLTAAGFNPLLCKWTAPQTPTSQGCLPFFLTFDPTDPAMPLDQTWYPGTGDPQMPVTGDKALFGDLGNDYIVAGMGRVRVYGGWGFDLVDLRASTQEDGGLNDGPVPNLVNNGNGTFSLATANFVYGTPAWESLAYGGAGQDIYFAGTGGDRLIDWVGNHNSFYVPFSQFGMPGVSRTLQPFLPEFLYALSKSDGADPLLGVRADAFCASSQGPSNPPAATTRRTAARRRATASRSASSVSCSSTTKPGTSSPERRSTRCRRTLAASASTSRRRRTSARSTCPAPTAGRRSVAADLAPLRRGREPALRHEHARLELGAAPHYRHAGRHGSYTFAEGASTVSGTGVIGLSGTFGAVVDLSGFADGTITVTVQMTAGGKTTTLTGSMAKNSVAPPAPSVSAAVYANIATHRHTTSPSPARRALSRTSHQRRRDAVADFAGGMDFVGSNGTVTIPIYVASLIDGPITITVTLTNGAGTAPRRRSSSRRTRCRRHCRSRRRPTSTTPTSPASRSPRSESRARPCPTRSPTERRRSPAPARRFRPAASGTPTDLSKLKDGPVTLTVTETDPAGNPSVSTVSLWKAAVPPPAADVALNPLDDSGVSGSDYVTAVNNPRITVTTQTGTTATIYVNGTLYTGRSLRTAPTRSRRPPPTSTATSPRRDASKQLVIDTAPPSGSFTIAGAKVINGQLSVNDPTLSLQFSFTDGGSGTSRMAFSTDGGSTFSAAVAYANAAGVTLPATDGIYTVSVRSPTSPETRSRQSDRPPRHGRADDRLHAQRTDQQRFLRPRREPDAELQC